MEAYEELKSLGRGSYAVVKLARRRTDGELFVIKRFHVPLSELTPKERNEISNEIRLLSHLRHPNIVQFFHNFVENGVACIVMVRGRVHLVDRLPSSTINGEGRLLLLVVTSCSSFTPSR